MQTKCEICSVTEMEQKLRLCAFMTLIEGEYLYLLILILVIDKQLNLTS